MNARPLRRASRPILLCLPLLLAACDGSSSSGSRSNADRVAPQFTVSPSITPNGDPSTPLAATVQLQTDEPAVVTLDIDDGMRTWSVTPSPTPTTDHVLAVLGVHPDRIHSITVRARDDAGNERTAPGMLVFPTPPLPAEFPPLDVLQSDPTRMEPGVVFFPAVFNSGAASGTFVVGLDQAGEVVWYHSVADNVGDLRRLRNGNLLFQYGNYGLREIDMFGTIVGEWWAANVNPAIPVGAVPVAVDTFHHEVYELPPGHAADFLALSTELRAYTNYPASVLDPTQTVPSANVVGDVIVEFRRDGSIVNEWRLLDLLDPYRVSYDSLLNFWDGVYGMPTVDWSHANAVILDDSDDAVIVSCRHQDVVLEISRATGTLDWLLGDPGRWQTPWSLALIDPEAAGYWETPASMVGGPPGPAAFEWNYHQHSPHITPSGSLLLFDNGVQRAIPPDPGLALAERYSRAVEFAIDEQARSVRQLWSYGDPTTAPYFSPIVGDADLMSTTDNVLVTDGGKVLVGVTRWARIFEVTRGSATPEIAFEVQIRDDVGIPPTSWLVYRAEKLADVYP